MHNQYYSVWNKIMRAGEAHSVRPFGVEAQRLLRLEKGHLIVGQDTDALTTPYHANLVGLIRHQKKFFVGQRSLKIHENTSKEVFLTLPNLLVRAFKCC